MEGEKVGLANRVFGVVYHARAPMKRLKKANRALYYTLKYGLIAAMLYAGLFPGW